jgi:hypothetical protein
MAGRIRWQGGKDAEVPSYPTTITYFCTEKLSRAIANRLNVACFVGSADNSCTAMPSMRKNAKAEKLYAMSSRMCGAKAK